MQLSVTPKSTKIVFVLLQEDTNILMCTLAILARRPTDPSAGWWTEPLIRSTVATAMFSRKPDPTPAPRKPTWPLPTIPEDYPQRLRH
jgi:hypothetical protein